MNMIRKKIIIITILLTSTFYVFADTDPFSRSFSSEGNETSSSFSTPSGVLGGNPDVHPLLSLDENQYLVKGVIINGNNSLAIVSYPGGNDYIMREGDPLGKNMYTIQKINFEDIMLSKNDAEDVDLNVFNPVMKSGSDD